MSQVHKENLSAVDNALPNRAGLDIEIFGMEGIPEDIAAQHRTRVLTQFHQAESERRTASGNLVPGAAGGTAAKKLKVEAPSDLKKRLAEHKAKLAATENGESSGSATPQPHGSGQTALGTMQDHFVSMHFQKLVAGTDAVAVSWIAKYPDSTALQCPALIEWKPLWPTT